MEKYEYKVEVSYGGSLNEDQLNQIGREGWELVSIITIPPGMVTKLKADHVFKRKCK